MTLLDQIQNYWAIIMFLGSFVASCVYFKFNVEDLKKRLGELEDHVEKRMDGIETHVEKNEAAVNALELWMTRIDTKLDILLGGNKK